MTSIRPLTVLVFLALAIASRVAAASPENAPPANLPSSSSVEALAVKPSFGVRTRCWLREKMVSENDLASFGLVLDDHWLEADPAKPVVIIVHGFNSSPVRNLAMLKAVRDAGYPCGTFAYANDYLIPAGAQLLSSELRRFARAYPDRRVVLVCHSMGGLVARACVEDSLYDPGNVIRLVMIAPPTSGTMIAHFAVGTDFYEHWLSRTSGGPWARIHDSIVDGLGEAADELCPGSDFLEELNARPRNPRIHYSILLGTGARMSEAEMEWIRASVVAKLADLPGGENSAKRLDALLGDLDELVEGKGDGVVSVARGRLTDVNDTLVLPFGHLAVTGEPANDVIRQVQQAVLERLN